MLSGTACVTIRGMTEPRTLVFLHAFPLGTRVWAPQLTAFAGWKVVTPAFPGFDDDVAHASTMEAFATHMNDQLDRLGITRAVIAGLSLGGYAAFAVLRQRPDRASALILADTKSTADGEQAREARRRMLEILNERGPTGVFEEMRPKLLGATTHAERPEVVAKVKALIESQKPAAIEGAIRAMLDRPDSTPSLPSIAVPTLIVVGEEDVLTPPAESEAMAAAIPGSTLTKLPRAGHLPNLETPAAFNEAVSKFLSLVP